MVGELGLAWYLGRDGHARCVSWEEGAMAGKYVSARFWKP